MESVTITKRQARAIFALVWEREEITKGANAALKEIGEAIEDQLEMLRQKLGMPEGKYQLVQEGETLRLQHMPEPETDINEEERQLAAARAGVDVDVPVVETDIDADGRRVFPDEENEQSKNTT